MVKTRDMTPLVAAAAALDDELRAFADLAAQTKREPMNTDRSMSRATQALSDSATYHARIEERLKNLVHEIESARLRQQESVEALVSAARELERRAKSREELLRRFAELGASAGEVNEMALDITARKSEGAKDTEVLERLGALETRMDSVVADAQAIAESAVKDDWPEIARQADAVRQQMQSARNKLLLAHRNVAGRAPS